MGVSDKSPEAERKVREIDAGKDRARRLRKVDESVRRVKALLVLSTASEDEILGYADKGHFD